MNEDEQQLHTICCQLQVQRQAQILDLRSARSQMSTFRHCGFASRSKELCSSTR